MGDQFTAAQWQTLLVMMDTVIPSVRRESTTTDSMSQLTIPDVQYNAAVDHMKRVVVDAPDDTTLDEFLDEVPSRNPVFQDYLKRLLVQYVREDARQSLKFLLSAIDTRIGSLLLTGTTTPFSLQSAASRSAVLQGWRSSRLPPLQDAFKQFTSIGKNIWIKTSPTFYPITGFPAVPQHYKPGPHYEYDFIRLPYSASVDPEIIETDVVIVGSGCGGAVCAKNLAEGGHRVLVVDKSYYFKPSELPMTEAAGGIHLFENAGVDQSDDGSITVIAGSAWGGGGTINWSASLQTQSFVRKEWAEDRGLAFFGTNEFQECLDRVCNRMGASTEFIKHNHGNQVLLEGARKLGYHVKPVPQNTGGATHDCGHCTLGCGSAEKQGPVVSWLPDAAKAGATFMEGFKADRVVFDKDGKTAIGVRGTWTSRNSAGTVEGDLSQKVVREVFVRAKKVIISSGTLWSPIILLKSGLKNPNIGRHLYLHPCALVASVYPEDVRPWEGAILTSVCTQFENLDGHGHGVKLEATCMLPSWCMAFLPWTDGFGYKMQALRYRHTNAFICLVRERDPGRVYLDVPSGGPRFAYTPSAFDRKHHMIGMQAMARIAYVTGASEIHALIANVAPFVRDPAAHFPSPPPSIPSGTLDPADADPRFAAWLANLEKVGNAAPAGLYGSAHQMGTSRMSAQPQHGVVDPQGAVWGTSNLYVSDASVFPSASGVNPMVTNMAISDWISRGVDRTLKLERGGVVSGMGARL